ncbi:MAG: ABC transporter ATP-binding protein [Alphaproteobacteria bacterium]
MTETDANGNAIALSGVSLTLSSLAGPVPILRGVDFAVRRGEAVAVLGPSGAGKSTLLAVIAGLERADEGSVTVAGERLDGLDEDALAMMRRRAVGIVFQSFHLIPTMTALENVAVPLELAGRRDAFEAARAALEAVGLGRRVRHFPSQLSGGEQQRTALARAFAPRPAVLLADEPTGNLDGATGAQVIDLLFGLRAEASTTLVLVTHDPAIAARCDRIVHIAEGRIADG